MKQVELAQRLGVSKAYISMVLGGKKKPSKQVATRLKRMGIEVNSQVNFEPDKGILSHARLPVPTLPHSDLMAEGALRKTRKAFQHSFLIYNYAVRA